MLNQGLKKADGNVRMGKTVLLTGATGCLGRAVLREGRNADVHWLPVGRQVARPSDMGSGAWIHADLVSLPAALSREGAIAQLCVHAGALVHARNCSDRAFRRLNVGATVAIATALADKGLERFIFISSVAAGEEALSPYGASKLEAEHQLRELSLRRNFHLVILRPTTLYGPFDRGNIGKLYQAISRRRYVRLVPAAHRKSLLAAEAGAAAVLAAIQLSGPPSHTILADPEPYSFGDIENAIASAAGVRLPPRFPTSMGWAAAAVGTVFEGLTHRAMPISLGRFRTLRRTAIIEPDLENPLVQAAHARLGGTFASRMAQAYGGFEKI